MSSRAPESHCIEYTMHRPWPGVLGRHGAVYRVPRRLLDAIIQWMRTSKEFLNIKGGVRINSLHACLLLLIVFILSAAAATPLITAA